MTQGEASDSGTYFTHGGADLPDTNPNTAGTETPGSLGDTYVINTEESTPNPPNDYNTGYQYYPNQALYNTLVAPTGGIWAPVRPPCDPSLYPHATISKGQCQDPINPKLVNELNNYCDKAVTDHDNDPNKNSSIPNPDKDVVDIPGIIENGALICDPYCRDTAQSVGDNVEKIYENNPYILVESAFKRSDYE
jgi:hypothetical protein